MFDFKKLKESPASDAGPSTGYQSSVTEHPLQELDSSGSQPAQASSSNPFNFGGASVRVKEAFQGARSAFSRGTTENPAPPPATAQADASYQNQPSQASQQPPQQFGDPTEISPYFKHSYRIGTWMAIPIYLH
eukprot:9126782-Pyramimonas_sp.AAC.1